MLRADVGIRPYKTEKECIPMKAYVNQKACIRCGLCPTLCPEVFSLPDDGSPAQAITDDVPQEHQIAAQNAADSCPTEAISIK